jgi:hypothetical protein
MENPGRFGPGFRESAVERNSRHFSAPGRAANNGAAGAEISGRRIHDGRKRKLGGAAVSIPFFSARGLVVVPFACHREVRAKRIMAIPLDYYGVPQSRTPRNDKRYLRPRIE